MKSAPPPPASVEGILPTGWKFELEISEVMFVRFLQTSRPVEALSAANERTGKRLMSNLRVIKC